MLYSNQQCHECYHFENTFKMKLYTFDNPRGRAFDFETNDVLRNNEKQVHIAETELDVRLQIQHIYQDFLIKGHNVEKY